MKPPIAKISNVIGRGYTLVFTVSCYVLSYILMASARTIGTYAGGFVLYNVGQSGTNVMTVSTTTWNTTTLKRGGQLLNPA